MKKLFLFIVVSMMISTSVYAQSYSQQWIKTYSGSGKDTIHCIRQTMDGGYIAAGQTDSSIPGGVIEAWIVKLDVNGDISWQKTYRPGTFVNTAWTVQQTTDGGYILGGYGGTFDFPSWILRLDAEGDVIWQKAYGVVEFISIQQTPDGGYIAGADSDFGILVLKIDENGNVIWQKACSGDATDDMSSLLMTSDGGYIVVRLVPGLISKLDSGGNIIWQKTYSNCSIFSIQQTADGGYISAGVYDEHALILKLDENGNSVWQKTYIGGDYKDFASFIQQNSDGGFTVIGSIQSDVWFLKLESNGSIIWQKTFELEHRGGFGFSFGNTMDGGYFLASNTSKYCCDGDTGYPMLLKLDSNGELPDCDIIGNSNATVSDVTVDSHDINATYESDPITGMALDIIPQDVFTETTVVCQYNDPNDIDGDGIANNPDGTMASSTSSSSFLADEDNCPNIPNGPFLGTCSIGNVGDSCITNEACGVSGICSMNQEDTDGDGIGDVCDSSGAQIPTLSEWGMIIFVTLILGISVVMLYKRRVT